MNVPRQSERIVTYLTDLEQAAEEILTDRQTIIDYDRKRNANRESLRHLKNSSEKKTWIAMGNNFFKLEKVAVEDMIHKDQVKLDTSINEIRDNLKKKVDRVRDIEEKPALKGYNLKPLNSDEMRGLNIPQAYQHH
ncbi:p53 and DNA damage-regulated protein 1 isoform X2 [Folsomia candida]|uniref:Uncharacterized protein n=1 Tax=Folsomia candida TaxID=158441 RepID=A0A226EX26_FOLCA|nr:p53 and DNA damage-regulated protein 1 isoform X2 [Folsomia candida]XP_035704069.1 p53 and DNA damage-regulated protein 1 isoform X2 [Folsomia candida]OXA61176.1 hypothetical protein Fcan01_05035 [Folsomia candida]